MADLTLPGFCYAAMWKDGMGSRGSPYKMGQFRPKTTEIKVSPKSQKSQNGFADHPSPLFEAARPFCDIWPCLGAKYTSKKRNKYKKVMVLVCLGLVTLVLIFCRCSSQKVAKTVWLRRNGTAVVRPGEAMIKSAVSAADFQAMIQSAASAASQNAKEISSWGSF